MDIKVISSNRKERTFTIEKNGIKYRTGKQAMELFKEMEFYTSGDWDNFLSTQDDYYPLN